MTEDRDRLEDLEIRLLLDAIASRYGYDLREYAGPSIRRRVHAALSRSGCPNLGELQHRVLHDRRAFFRMLDDLTVRVSDMFRDPAFFLVFRGRVLPHLRSYPVINVWHCGAASGEEAYATAIVLEEEGLYDRAQIYATDLSATALRQAEEGVYPAQHLEKFRENYAAAGGKASFDRYCTHAYGAVGMHPSLRRNILFFQHDLVSDQVFAEMQVVFCRNVLIYFGADLRGRALRKIAGSLCHGGFLCLGTSEPLAWSGGGSPFVEFSRDHRIYRHEGARDDSA